MYEAMPEPILVINGPNINMLGKREPEIYGSQTLKDIEDMCRACAKKYGAHIHFMQSNHEGEIVTWIQEALGRTQAIIINPAAYTHTSIAIMDALKLHPKELPIIEVHLSDVKKREKYRQISYVSEVAHKTICGKGAHGYIEAIEYLFE